MNGRGYRTRYRRGPRRSSVLPIIILIVTALLILFLLFLLIGNSLGNRSEGQKTSTSVTEELKEPPKAAPASVGCFLLDIEGGAAAETSNNIARLASSGATAVSIEAKGADSSLLYSSRVANSFGKQGTSTLDMATVISRAKGRGMYVSVYFTLDFMRESNSDVRAAKLGYEAALVSELCTAGADDVMVYAPDTSYENYTELLKFAEFVKTANGKARVGIAVKHDIYSSQNAAVMIDALYGAFDVVGIDLSEIENKDIDKQIESVLAGNLYYILRYNARVILPSLADAEMSAKLSDILAASNAANFQYVK